MTSMPASSSSSTSCQRLSLREPGHVGVRQLVDQRDLRAPGEHRVDVHLGEASCRGGRASRRGTTSRPSSMLGGVRPAVRLDEPDDDVGAALERGGGPRRAWRRSCRRRARRRGRPAAVPRATRPAPSACSACRRAAGRSSARLSSSTFDPRLAEEAERPALGVLARPGARTAATSSPRVAATRGDLLPAYAGLMCGSSPEPLAVSASGGTSRRGDAVGRGDRGPALARPP